jgi:hypothetical protein
MRQGENGGKDLLGEFDFPRRRWWRPTAAWEQAWRRNLARAPRRHTAEQSLAIKHAVWDWREQDPTTRPIQEHVAASLGVSKQYINRLVRTLPPRQTLPPVTQRDVRQPERREVPTQRPVPPDYDPRAHGWNCDCAGCRATALIEAALRAVKERT